MCLFVCDMFVRFSFDSLHQCDRLTLGREQNTNEEDKKTNENKKSSERTTHSDVGSADDRKQPMVSGKSKIGVNSGQQTFLNSFVLRSTTTYNSKNN